MRKFFICITVFFMLFVFGTNSAIGSDKELTRPIINSEAAIVIEANTGKILFEKNSKIQMLPASITKIATAIYAIEKGNMDDIVTVSENARNAEGTRVYLEIGEQITLKKLIQGLLINSGNDAGVAIAEHLDGSVEGFAENINQYLQGKVGTTKTNFENPHGLYNPSHLTTAEDMAKVTQYAIKNKVFREIFSTKELPWKGQAWDTILYSHHKLLRERPYEGVYGGKTGYVDQSGHTLVTTAKKGNLEVIVVTLKGASQNVAYNDTVILLDYSFNNFQNTVINKGTKYTIESIDFKTDKSLYITHQKGEQITENIIKNGILEIENDHNEILETFQLERMKYQTNDSVSTNKLVSDKNKENNVNLYSFGLFSVLVTLVLSILFKKTRNR
jgi:serine-type D-Ala-D-Ala carboxypeptidase (penicillin-binding protein 5/6)